MLGSLIVGGGIILWLAPFLVAKRGSGGLAAVDRRARWGLLLEVIAIGLMLQSRFWAVQVLSWRVVASAVFFRPAAVSRSDQDADSNAPLAPVLRTSSIASR